MGEKWLLSILVSACCTLSCRLLPGPSGWWQSLVKTPFVSLVIILSLISTFLGQPRGVAQIAEDPVDIIRFLRILVLSILTICSLIGLFRTGRNSSSWKGIRWLAIYAVVAMMSSVYSPFPALSVYKGFEVMTHVLVALLVGTSLRQLEDIKHVLNVLLLAMLFLVISALVGTVTAPSHAFAKLKSTGPMAFVLRGVYPEINANTLSQLSGMLATCSLCLYFSSKERKFRIGTSIVFIIATTCLILAHSRTSLFAFVAAVCFTLMYFRGRTSMLIIGSIGITVWISDLFTEYIFRGQSQELLMSFSGRTNFWKLVLERIWQAPILGHGFYSSQRMTWGVSSVDNTYLEVILGVGFVGLTFFCMAIASVFLNLWRVRPRGSIIGLDSDWRLVWVEQVVLLFFLFFRSITGPSFNILHPNLTIFAIIAVTSYSSYRMQGDEGRASWRRPGINSAILSKR